MGAGAGVRDPMGAHHWGSAIMVGLRGSPLPYFGGGVWAWRTRRNGTAQRLRVTQRLASAHDAYGPCSLTDIASCAMVGGGEGITMLA